MSPPISISKLGAAIDYQQGLERRYNSMVVDNRVETVAYNVRLMGRAWSI